jgi:hypothetical protein
MGFVAAIVFPLLMVMGMVGACRLERDLEPKRSSRP